MRANEKKQKAPRKPGSGGRRPGAGRPKEFVPTKAQRSAVKRFLALRSYTHAELCEMFINPASGDPISADTFGRAFRQEIRTAKIEIDGIALAGFEKQLRAGNMTAFIWHSKTQWGWNERRGTPITFALPEIVTAADIVAASAAVMAAVRAGQLTTAEGDDVSNIIERHRLAILTGELAAQIEQQESSQHDDD